MKCPICGFRRFFVKNSDDEYEMYPFELKDGEVCFDPDVDASEVPTIHDKTETFCDQCAWHGPFQEVKK